MKRVNESKDTKMMPNYMASATRWGEKPQIK
jgi:hypothetical protein